MCKIGFLLKVFGCSPIVKRLVPSTLLPPFYNKDRNERKDNKNDAPRNPCTKSRIKDGPSATGSPGLADSPNSPPAMAPALLL